jgi:hypothetical protein
MDERDEHEQYVLDLFTAVAIGAKSPEEAVKNLKEYSEKISIEENTEVKPI